MILKIGARLVEKDAQNVLQRLSVPFASTKSIRASMASVTNSVKAEPSEAQLR